MDFIFEYIDQSIFAAIILTIAFTWLLIQGVPIAVVIAVSSIITALFFLPLDTAFFIATQKMYGGIDSFTLLAIPFFILSGNLMNKGGIATRLIDLAKLMCGKLPGSLFYTNVVANMLFGAISGSSIASAAAVGGIMAPMQKKEGYDPVLSAAVNVCSANSGILIPPSGPLILYSLVSGGTSIAALFIAGYIPGILLGLSVMITVFFMVRKNKDQIPAIQLEKSSLSIILGALPSLLMIIIVIGGIIIGIFTATEGSAVAALYSLILSLIYRLATPKEYIEAIKSTVITSSMILFLIAASGIMSYVMTITRMPEAIAETLGYFDSPFMILLVMNIILLLVGTFLDLTPTVLIFTPIFLPIAIDIGMDPVHFGIVMILNNAIGNITPPVGSVLFVGCSIANVTLEDLTRRLWPFFASLCVVLLIVTYWSGLSLMLPRLFNLM